MVLSSLTLWYPHVPNSMCQRRRNLRNADMKTMKENSHKNNIEKLEVVTDLLNEEIVKV